MNVITSQDEYQAVLRKYRQLHQRFYEVRDTPLGQQILRELSDTAKRLDTYRSKWWLDVPDEPILSPA